MKIAKKAAAALLVLTVSSAGAGTVKAEDHMRGDGEGRCNNTTVLTRTQPILVRIFCNIM